MFAIFVVILAAIYGLLTWERLEVFKILLTSFFPLALLILAVLGSIVFGLATPTEAAAVGARIGCPIAQSGEERMVVTRQLGSFKTSMHFI